MSYKILPHGGAFVYQVLRSVTISLCSQCLKIQYTLSKFPVEFMRPLVRLSLGNWVKMSWIQNCMSMLKPKRQGTNTPPPTNIYHVPPCCVSSEHTCYPCRFNPPSPLLIWKPEMCFCNPTSHKIYFDTLLFHWIPVNHLLSPTGPKSWSICFWGITTRQRWICILPLINWQQFLEPLEQVSNTRHWTAIK